MKLENVLIATKETSLKYYKQKYDDLYEKFNSSEIWKMYEEHKEHEASVESVISALNEAGIKHTKIFTPYFSTADFENKDLIVSLGGDGTILKASRYIRDKTPILNVKAEKDSFGALCTIDANNFKKSLTQIMRGNYIINEWTRVQGEIDGKKDLALNEIYVGSQFFNEMARYTILHDKSAEISGPAKDCISENQKSGKLIISSGTGSTGWYNNSSNMPPFDKTSKELRYVVLEAMASGNYQMKSGVILPGEELRIISHMSDHGIVSYDCINKFDKGMYAFNHGKILTVKISDTPLNVVIPKL